MYARLPTPERALPTTLATQLHRDGTKIHRLPTPERALPTTLATQLHREVKKRLRLC